MKEIGQFNYVYYDIPRINPDGGIEINEPFLFGETSGKTVIDSELGNQVEVSFSFGLQQQITISADDQRKQDYPIVIRIARVQGEQELIDKAAAFLREKLSEQRIDLSFPTSFFARLETKALIAFAKPQLIAETEGIQAYSIRFMREHIKSIRVYNEPNFYRLWMYGLIFLVVVIGLVAFVAVLRRR